ncbi:MAG TPA: hypothetical protein H9694_05495 [Firmicutes bacterium]|nr:hypothetical protein [Bacillota bacterium]
MKRVKAACICQTLHFLLKEDAAHDWAVKQVEREVEQYKANLERSRTKYKILEQDVQPDGSIILKIVKQYNTSPVGDYLN